MRVWRLAHSVGADYCLCSFFVAAFPSHPLSLPVVLSHPVFSSSSPLLFSVFLFSSLLSLLALILSWFAPFCPPNLSRYGRPHTTKRGRPDQHCGHVLGDAQVRLCAAAADADTDAAAGQREGVLQHGAGREVWGAVAEVEKAPAVAVEIVGGDGRWSTTVLGACPGPGGLSSLQRRREQRLWRRASVFCTLAHKLPSSSCHHQAASPSCHHQAAIVTEMALPDHCHL